MKGSQSRRGMALVLVISLLALAVLIVVAIAALGKIDAASAQTAELRTQARQNALTALGLAFDRLQQLAGEDSCVTAMAGIAGAAGGSEFRHWCGVWDSSGNFLGWLTSGAAPAPTPALSATNSIFLVSENSVGPRPATVSAYTDEEYVQAGLLSIPRGDGTEAGSIAYWIGDEGCKTSLFVADAHLPSGGFQPLVASTPTNIARLGLAFKTFDVANAAHVLAYEQSRHLRYSASNLITAASLRDAFHHATLVHRSWDSAANRMTHGKLNLNTTSAVVWRGLLESYQAQPAEDFGSAARLTSAVNTIANGIAASTSGKPAFAPFATVEDFLGSSLLASALSGASGVPVATFADVVRPMLVTRSDTFRIRAYGRAEGRFADETGRAEAYCEAIVQRTEKPAPVGSGRRFVVIYFRWLGTQDL